MTSKPSASGFVRKFFGLIEQKRCVKKGHSVTVPLAECIALHTTLSCSNSLLYLICKCCQIMIKCSNRTILVLKTSFWLNQQIVKDIQLASVWIYTKILMDSYRKHSAIKFQTMQILIGNCFIYWVLSACFSGMFTLMPREPLCRLEQHHIFQSVTFTQSLEELFTEILQEPVLRHWWILRPDSDAGSTVRWSFKWNSYTGSNGDVTQRLKALPVGFSRNIQSNGNFIHGNSWNVQLILMKHLLM